MKLLNKIDGVLKNKIKKMDIKEIQTLEPVIREVVLMTF
jgi:hypothetical protein